jgi:hypothetical protein
MTFGNNYGVFGILILVLDIYAIIKIAQSSTEPLKKAVWIVVILLLPILGLLLWWLFGPKSN